MEVARQAGVGVASVSRVLTGHPDASEAMRRRVLRAVDELGYEPNLMAQGLRSLQSSTIGAMFSDFANPLLSQIIQGAEQVLRDAGYSLLLTSSEGSSDMGARHLRVLGQRRVDGLIVMAASETDAGVNRLLASSTLARELVIIDRQLPAGVRAGYVLSDHRTGFAAAARHLLDLGHRRFAFVISAGHPSGRRASATTC